MLLELKLQAGEEGMLRSEKGQRAELGVPMTTSSSLDVNLEVVRSH